MKKRIIEATIIDVKKITGRDLKRINKNWFHPMQQITTDKGIFFDNYNQTDWLTKLNQTLNVEIQEKINQDTNLTEWIREIK